MAEDQLTRQGLHDPLTGLPTRSLFIDRLDHAVSHLRRRQMVAVMIIEIENLAPLRLAHGRGWVDQLLVAIGRRMELCMRSGDTLARLSGDEFTLLLEELEEAGDVSLIAQRVIGHLGRPFTVSAREVSIEANVGVSFGLPGVTTAGELLKHADTALHRAKAKGANRFVIITG